ncbi:MAG: hypothetical protein ABI051_12275 [Vicinamibacterales bacterium]
MRDLLIVLALTLSLQGPTVCEAMCAFEPAAHGHHHDDAPATADDHAGMAVVSADLAPDDCQHADLAPAVVDPLRLAWSKQLAVELPVVGGSSRFVATDVPTPVAAASPPHAPPLVVSLRI